MVGGGAKTQIKLKILGLDLQLSGGSLSQHVQGLGFDHQQHKRKVTINGPFIMPTRLQRTCLTHAVRGTEPEFLWSLQNLKQTPTQALKALLSPSPKPPRNRHMQRGLRCP